MDNERDSKSHDLPVAISCPNVYVGDADLRPLRREMYL